MIPYIMTIIITPLCGWITDKFGKRLHVLGFGIIILLFVYAFFFFISSENLIFAIIPLAGFGIFNGILECTVWPMFCDIVPEEVLGMGYAGVSIANNIFMVIVP